jgi:hypothetical protein
MATLSPLPVSDTVPTFDIVKEYRYKGESADNIEQCSQDEAAALAQLKTEWVAVCRCQQAIRHGHDANRRFRALSSY